MNNYITRGLNPGQQYEYIYLGDKLTDPALRNKPCRAIRNEAGKCIRSPMGTMLVEFEGGMKSVIVARRLRKIIK